LCLGGVGEANDVVFQLARGNVTHARHEADLVVDEDERGVLGRQGLIGAISIRHRFLLWCGLGARCRCPALPRLYLDTKSLDVKIHSVERSTAEEALRNNYDGFPDGSRSHRSCFGGTFKIWRIRTSVTCPPRRRCAKGASAICCRVKPSL